MRTGLAISIPAGAQAKIAYRSGHAFEGPIEAGAGALDTNYRGELGIVLFNHADDELCVRHGNQTAQLVLEKITMPVVEEVQELESTSSGASGFSCTGIQYDDAGGCKSIS